MAYNTYGDIGAFLGQMAARSRGPNMSYGYGAMSAPLPGPMARPPMMAPPPAGVRPPVARPQGPLPGLGGPGYVPGQGPAIPDYGAAFGGPSTLPPPPAMPPPQSPPPTPGPSTKLTPGGTLKFAWGGGTPEEYQPGITDVLQMEGAPMGVGPEGPTPMRGGFMGVKPAASGGGFGGGFSPRTTASMSSDEMIEESARGAGPEMDWSRVANPLAFEAYRERPVLAEIERAAKDPMWREREQAKLEAEKLGIQRESEIAVARERATAEAAQVEAANQRLRKEVDTMAQGWIDIENKKRQSQGQPPLSLQEEQQFYMLAQSRVTGRASMF